MQHGKHNLKKGTEFRIYLSVIVLAFQLLSPSNAHATVKMGTLKGMKSFKLMVLTIANLNFAMKQAAENPMDGWRRQNVAHAMGMLPPAILAMAKDFKQGKLHDGDLPIVQGIMGGFMKKDFVGQYQSFMKNPSKDKIPKTGAGFPEEAIKAAEKTTIQMDESKRDVASVAALSDSGKTDSGGTDSNPKISQAQLASLDSSGLVYRGKSNAKAETLGKRDDKAIRMIEEKRFDAKGETAGTNSNSTFAEEMNQEIMKVERGLSGSAIRKSQAVLDAEKARETEEAAEKADFFKAKKKKAESVESNQRGRKTLKKRPVLDKTSSIHFHRMHPVAFMVGSLFKIVEGRAFAETVTSPPQVTPPAIAAPFPGGPNGNRPDGPGGGCQNCGPGGGPGGGGQGGGGAAEILQGMAFMMMGIAPMVSAAMQADADKKIAETNARTQIQLTQMTAETSRYLADRQKQLAEFQAKVTEEIAQKNNDAQTERLNIQLAELKASREQARESEKEKRALEDKYNEQRIQLAQKQADDNLKFQQQTLVAQVTQAGLATGFKNARDSSGALSVDRVQGSSFASTGVSNSNPFATSSFNAVTGGGAGGAGASAGTSAGNSAATSGGLAFMAPRNKLIASVGNTPASENAERDLVTGAWVKKPTQYGAVATRGLASKTAKVSTRGFVNGTAKLAQGSTRGVMQRIPNEFDKYLALASTPSANAGEAYAGDRNARIRGAEVATIPGSAHGKNAVRGVTSGRAYNARGIREISTGYGSSN